MWGDQLVGSGSQGWTATQHVPGGGRPTVVLHSGEGGKFTRSFTTWYWVGPERLSGP